MENTAHFLKEGTVGIPTSVRHIHFIGILGAGMRVAAHIAASLGYTVSGTDSAAPIAGGSMQGIPVLRSGDPASGIFSADLAVFSLAIGEGDPEIRAAGERGIPRVSRADFFGALMRLYHTRIGIAGTHGKSTVTAMCAALLTAAGKDPTVAVGAPLFGREDGYRAGKGDLLLFEACEYKRSFLSFSPTIAVVLNAEWDHPDCFPNRASVLDAFGQYLSLPSVRVVVLPTDDPDTLALGEHLNVPIVTFGEAPSAMIRASGIECGTRGSSFLLSVGGKQIGRVALSVPGEHNVRNALAAYAVAYALGIPLDAAALSSFPGIGRRLSYRGEYAGTSYYDDYAHHPTEIRAGIAALPKKGRLIAVFQPHTYTRSAALFSELCAALREADLVIVTDIYAAREKNESGITARSLVAAIGPRAIYMPTPETAALAVRVRARRGDTVLVMGAGDLSARFFRGALAFSE